MKGFKFTLDPLLRLKGVEKSRIEVELAEHQRIVSKYVAQISSENNSISEMLLEAQMSVENKHSVSCLLSMPSSISEKKNNIYMLEKKVAELNKKSQEILGRLSTKVSELKKVQELKDEQISTYRKKLEKLEQQTREEMYNIQKESKKNRIGA